MSSLQVPTILIGLGGLGSSIVDMIYGWIPADKRGFVAIHTFDTNVNDISKLRNLTKDNVTQTSTNWTVAEYLRMADESVKDWFPYEQTEIQRKSLTDGAGQVRAVSRLAYRAAMESGKLGNLHKSINHIFRETGGSMNSSARVMIVSSIVGGTGAGIFLQTAMYMRDVLEYDFQRKNVLIRGAFILPDVLVLSNVIQGDEIENIRANAYACLKELNAVTKNASVANNPDKINIELEYKPNQVDAQGRIAHVITSRNLPYNFCFLFDFENTEKNNLRFLGNYIQQVARSTYLDLFSPMANDRFSKQDNQILSMIEHSGMSRYCGAGVSSLVYPYEEILDYCALQWATGSLSNDWLKIDEQFESDFRQYEIDLKNGIPREKPILRDRYRDILYRLATQQNPRPFFKLAYTSAHILNKRNEIERAKADLFMEALNRRVEAIINDDAKLRDAHGQCGLDENRLKDKATAKDEIIGREEALFFYEDTIRKFIHNTKNYLVNEVAMQDGDHPQMLSGDDYKLNTWFLKQPEPLHPVTVRYVLYQIDALLDARIKELTPLNDKLEQAINNYKRAYDLDETEDVIETAGDRLELASRQGLFGKMFNNQLKDFVNEYVDKSGKQFNNLMRYRKDRLTELVYRELQKAIQEMQVEWEKYFKNLKDVRSSLNNELQMVAAKHDNAADPTVRFVLASKEMKAKLYETVRMGVSGDELPPAISEQIYKGQYQRFTKKRKGDYITEQLPQKVEEMFRQDVLKWCIQEMRKEDALNLNCIRALRREAELRSLADNQVELHIKDQVGILNNLARPYVPGNVGGTEINAWGVNPDCAKELSGNAKNELFGGSDLVEHPAFSPYEIIRSRTIYGMTIDNFAKFYCGDNIGGQPGEYYKAYTARIKKLTQQGNTVTPHLDKRWHLPAYLPEISAQRVQEDRTNINRALIWGIIMGYLQNINDYGRLTWLFNDDAGSRLIQEGEKPTERYVHSLHTALLHNPIIVDKVMRRTTDQWGRDIADKRDNIEEHLFYNRAQQINYFAAPNNKPVNVLELILRYPEGNPGDSELPKQSADLMRMLFAEIVAYYVQVFGKHRERMAKDKAFAYIDQLVANSEYYQQADRNSMQFISWQNMLAEVKKS